MNNIAASASKDIKWQTWTCTFGFPVQGIFPGVDYTDVNTTCRSYSQKFIASGEDTQKVCLYKYPCVQTPHANCRSFIGHSSHVTKVKFSVGDNYLFSTGGNDKCAIIWETDFGTGKIENPPPEPDDLGDGVDDSTDVDTSDFVQKKDYSKKSKTTKKDDGKPAAKAAANDDALFDTEDAGAGDQFMAVKPWLGQIKSPSWWPPKPPADYDKAPNVQLTVDYVFGYRAKDCRNNVRYLRNGNIAYHAAALGIVLDIAANKQRFFDKHIDDITAFEMHPDGIKVATGEVRVFLLLNRFTKDSVSILDWS